ncbi:MAG: hypothetical protein WAS36_04605 [Candidatus Saccharimonadales bacterium]
MPITERTLERLDQLYGPVIVDFTVTEVPEGAAPLHIKEQWLGVKLPVRESNLGRLATRYLDLLSGEFRENPYPVPIEGVEAVSALEDAGRLDASAHWTPYSDGLFTFRAYEGVFTAVRS